MYQYAIPTNVLRVGGLRYKTGHICIFRLKSIFTCAKPLARGILVVVWKYPDRALENLVHCINIDAGKG